MSAAQGYDVVTSYRLSVAGEMRMRPYRELARRHYRWRWLAWLMRGPKTGFGRVEPGVFAFWRADIEPCDSGSRLCLRPEGAQPEGRQSGGAAASPKIRRQGSLFDEAAA